MDIKDIIEKLSLEQKASLLVGFTNMTTRPIEELGIPSLIMSDGPNGLRKEADGNDNIANAVHTLQATCFPCGSALAQSFDNDLLYRVGKQIALECRFYGVNALLGPAINIKRNPLCGRNFEYLSEDPYLAGHLSANYINGVQSEKVIACVKHYCANNLEKWRYVGDSVVDLRALNEIYLKPFEIAIKESNPGMVMTSYNQINGKFASENQYIVKKVLYNIWNYKGLTVTDWGGMVNRDYSLTCGQDLEMPGMVDENIQKIVDAVNAKEVPMEDLNRAVRHLLEAIEKTRAERHTDEGVFERSKEVALEAAKSSAVLLKNENNVLPLDKNKKYVVIGDLFEHMRYQGSGSALINAKDIYGIKKAFDDEGIDYIYQKGYDSYKTSIDAKLEKAAVKATSEIKTIIYFGGLTDLSESEGYDRKDMKLEKNQRHLLQELAKLGKTLICVFFGGAAFEIPAIEKINGVLYMNLPGQMGGKAVTDLLFGHDSPSGRLAFTWMKQYEDVPFGDEFCKTPIEQYKESIFVGYRYYSSINKEVLFPFGFGLSYNEAVYSNYDIKKHVDYITVSLDVENKSDKPIKDTIQVYVGAPHSNIPRPVKELKAYQKVSLLPNQKKRVELIVQVSDLAIFDRKRNDWVVENGDYIVYLSKNVNEDIFKTMVEVKGEQLYSSNFHKPYWNVSSLTSITQDEYELYLGRRVPKYKPKRPYTLETPICEYRSLFASIIKTGMLSVGNKIIKNAKKIKDPQERQRQIKSGTFIKKMILQNCLRSLAYSAGGHLTMDFARALLDIANGKLISGIKKLKKK